MADTLSDAELGVYCQATEHSPEAAIARLTQIGNGCPQTGYGIWTTDPHYMSELVCGRVRNRLHNE